MLVGVAAVAGTACSSGPEGFAVTQPVGFVEFGPVPVADGGVHASGLALGGDLVDKPSRAMVTGTLALTSDGKFAVAADSERDQVVVVDLAAPEHAVQSVVDHAHEPCINHRRHLVVAALHRVDQLLVRGLTRERARVSSPSRLGALARRGDDSELRLRAGGTGRAARHLGENST